MNEYSSTILVSSDQPALVKELIGKARQLADPIGWGVAVVPLTEDPSLNEAGADMVYTTAGGMPLDGNPESNTAVIAEIIRQTRPALVLMGATKQGMEVAPRVAERTHSGYGAWAVQVDLDTNGQTKAQCILYTGQGLANYQFMTDTTILTVAAGVFKDYTPISRPSTQLVIHVPLNAPRVQILDNRPKGGGSSRIEEAKAVVDVGQGVKAREDLALLESISEWFGGQLGCSRPVASDRDWFPEWLGLSGKKISAELCLTIGISGAVQHIIGIRDTRVIVAINNDENAGVFSQVDYGVVADLYAFLPILLERLNARNVTPIWK